MNGEIEELESCDSCGVVFNIYAVKREQFTEEWKQDLFTCPLCNKKQEVEK